MNPYGNEQQATHAATVLLSGGVDSAACMKFLQARGYKVDTLFVDYGQAAAEWEHGAAKALAATHGCAFKVIKLSGPFRFGAGELVGRNAFLIFSALFFVRGTSGLLALGLHSGTTYYDCSESFFTLVNRLVGEHTDGRVTVLAPFLTWTKRDVYRYFLECGLSLADTYSCEAGVPTGCGTCLSCLDRQGLEC
jgi:7-cyano-7-deazaguanine synthase